LGASHEKSATQQSIVTIERYKDFRGNFLKAFQLVAAYAIPFAAAVLLVELHRMLTDTPEAEASSGMYAFGDALLLLVLLALGAVAGTIAARRIWPSGPPRWRWPMRVAAMIVAAGLVLGTWLRI
jgi:hypothetical protein